MEEILAAKEEEFANPQGAENSGDFAPSSQEGGDPPPPPADKQELTQNVARRIREERQKAKDELIAEVFGSPEELERFTADKEAEKERQALELEEALSQRRHLEDLQARLSLAAEPVLGGLFQDWEEEVNALSQDLEIETETALLFLLRERLPDILAQEREKSQQALLEKIIANQISPGALGGGGEEIQLAALNDKQFALLLEKVKSGVRDKI